MGNALETMMKTTRTAGNDNGVDIDERKLRPTQYGTVVKLSVGRAQKLKRGKSYYIVWGQSWWDKEEDPQGEEAIAVYRHRGIKTGENGKRGLVGDVNGDDHVRFYEYKGYFVTGSGADAVFLVKRWKRAFRPPAGLKRALLFSGH